MRLLKRGWANKFRRICFGNCFSNTYGCIKTISSWFGEFASSSLQISNRTKAAEMIEIRPVWRAGERLDSQSNEAIKKLLEIEQKIITGGDNCFEVVRLLSDSDNIEQLRRLQVSGKNDLVAGCELARTGYLKQAYSLWRSWFEQSIFLLYFLEAPLHQAAWKVSSEVSQSDSPQYRLMLHQLLTESGEKHPFTLVYDSRYTVLSDVLKISNTPKAQRPIPRATRVLTVLSQGVHGTYQPQVADKLETLCGQLEAHCIPMLSAASEVLSIFWVLFISNFVDLPEETLVQLREGEISVEKLTTAGIDNAPQIAALAPTFSEAFPSPKNG